MTEQQALEVIVAAARIYAQTVADDPDKTDEQQTEEDEIWQAIDLLAAIPNVPSRQQKLETALASLIAAIRDHWDGDEQDLDVVAGYLEEDFSLHDQVAEFLRNAPDGNLEGSSS